MNKYVLMLAAAGLISAAPAYYAFQAHAEDAAKVEAAAPAAEEAAAPAVDAVAGEEKVLEDGTKVFVGADKTVSVVAEDGSKTPAPDGEHKLKDGMTIMVKEGKIAE